MRLRPRAAFDVHWMTPPSSGPMFLPIMAVAMTKPLASPLTSGSTESMRSASAASMAAPETAPLMSLTMSSHSQLGTRPVAKPKMMSPRMPRSIRRLRPYLSERSPMRGAMTAKLSMKLLVNMPMLATVAPRPIA